MIIDGRDDNSISIELVMEVAKYFDINEDDAKKMCEYIRRGVRDNWEMLANKYGLSRGACEYMRPAFEACYFES